MSETSVRLKYLVVVCLISSYYLVHGVLLLCNYNNNNYILAIKGDPLGPLLFCLVLH